MIDTTSLEGKVLALIATGTTETGEQETVVFTGTMRRVEGNLTFERGPNGMQFNIPSDWCDRIKVVVPELSDILCGADYCVTLAVGNIKEGENISQFKLIGLKWPKLDQTEGAA